MIIFMVFEGSVLVLMSPVLVNTDDVGSQDPSNNTSPSVLDVLEPHSSSALSLSYNYMLHLLSFLLLKVQLSASLCRSL